MYMTTETRLPTKTLTFAFEAYIWSSYSQPSLLGCHTFYTNFYGSPAAVICSWIYLVNVEIYTIFHRCQQGTEDAVFLLLTFIRTSLILAITWPPRKCFKCHILLSLTSCQAEKTCGAPPGDVFCNCAFSPTKSLTTPRCLSSCCYGEQNNFKYGRLIWVSKIWKTNIIKEEWEKRHTWPLNPRWNS